MKNWNLKCRYCDHGFSQIFPKPNSRIERVKSVDFHIEWGIWNMEFLCTSACVYTCMEKIFSLSLSYGRKYWKQHWKMTHLCSSIHVFNLKIILWKTRQYDWWGEGEGLENCPSSANSSACYIHVKPGYVNASFPSSKLEFIGLDLSCAIKFALMLCMKA